MAEKRLCPNCGAEIPADALEGHCPKCLARLVFGSVPQVPKPAPDAEKESAQIISQEPSGGTEPAHATVAEPAPELTGQIIGRYKLLERIGEGAFGVVYMAEQLEPVQRRVALKILKAGMDSRQIIARFEAERQALALMDHANIAKVLDAGTTDVGRPYFVMELVRGIPITDYCDQNQLSTNQRLELFIKVCHAVQHAHQKAIIHRDIKPSNILVTLHDGEPVPKVIDFGIAKALGQKLTQKTLFTGFAQFLGTLAYMSPEQAELSGLDIDTRSDLYSLGLLLYELLTGVAPFDEQTFDRAAFDEIRRLIRETDPPKPSTRLQTLGGRATEIAKHRQTVPAALQRLIQGDLDWIVMKCLEKDRQRRYDTASSLALDLEHHLNHEPVSAAAPSRLYRAGKFVRRHKVAFATGTALLLLLLSGVAASTWEAARATRAERSALTEAAKSQQVARFLKEMLQSAGPSVAQGQDATLLKGILDRTAERIGIDLKNEPEVEIGLRSTLGETYAALGEMAKAETMFRAALTRATAHFGAEDRQTLRLQSSLSTVLVEARRLPEALTLLQKTVTLMKAKLGPTDPETLRAVTRLAETYVQLDRLAEAIPIFEAAAKGLTEQNRSNQPETLVAKDDLANAYRLVGRQAEAVQIMREVQKGYQATAGPDHPDTLRSMNNLALALRALGQSSNALPLLEEAVKRGTAILTTQHQDTLSWMHNLAVVYQDLNRNAEAAGLLEQVFLAQRRVAGLTNSNTLKKMVSAGNARHRAHQDGRALEILAEALAHYTAVLGAEHRDTLNCMRCLALAYRSTGQFTNAQPLLQEIVRRGHVKPGDRHPDTLLWMQDLAVLYEDLNRSAEGLTLQEQAVNGMKAALPPNDRRTLTAMDRLAEAYLEANRYTNAEALCREKLGTQRSSGPKDNPGSAWTFALLGGSLVGQQRYAEAETILSESSRVLEASQPGTARAFAVQGFLGSTRTAQGRYDQAEALVLKAGAGLEKICDIRFHSDRWLLHEAGERIVALYQAWGKLDLAAEWRRKLDSGEGLPYAARFNVPGSVAVDSQGNVFVADECNETIKKITPDGLISSVAGLVGNPGAADGVGSAARFRSPTGIAIDAAGNLYVGDQLNHTIRKITPLGVVTTMAGLPGSFGSLDGTGSEARFYCPEGVAVDNAGNVYVADNHNHTVRKVTAGGVVTTLAGLAGVRGYADGTRHAARFSNLMGVAVDGAGIVYVADTSTCTIRRVTPEGVVTTLAGQCDVDGSRDGVGRAALFNYPAGVATGSAGILYVADWRNCTIRKIYPGGEVTTIAGRAELPGSDDGVGGAALFDHPFGLAEDRAGNLFVGDSFNNVIRKITPDGTVSTLAGIAGSPGSQDSDEVPGEVQWSQH